MPRMTGGEAVVQTLVAEGVEAVFGLPGTHAPGHVRRPAGRPVDPAHHDAPRAGRDLHGGRLRPRERGHRRLPPLYRAGGGQQHNCDEHRVRRLFARPEHLQPDADRRGRGRQGLPPRRKRPAGGIRSRHRLEREGEERDGCPVARARCRLDNAHRPAQAGGAGGAQGRSRRDGRGNGPSPLAARRSVPRSGADRGSVGHAAEGAASRHMGRRRGSPGLGADRPPCGVPGGAGPHHRHRKGYAARHPSAGPRGHSGSAPGRLGVPLRLRSGAGGRLEAGTERYRGVEAPAPGDLGPHRPRPGRDRPHLPGHPGHGERRPAGARSAPADRRGVDWRADEPGRRGSRAQGIVQADDARTLGRGGRSDRRDPRRGAAGRRHSGGTSRSRPPGQTCCWR